MGVPSGAAGAGPRRIGVVIQPLSFRVEFPRGLVGADKREMFEARGCDAKVLGPCGGPGGGDL